MQQGQYLLHDQRLYPRQLHNERGELVFDMHPAKGLLREDVKNKLHVTTYHTSGELQASRPEYMLFKPKKCRERILQEIKLAKYFHYVELKREAMRKNQKMK